MISFNLVSDGWISVTRSGRSITRKVGIRELLNDANEHRSVQGTTPLETAALYRLLIAFIHSAYFDDNPPQDISDVENWKRVWHQRCFDKEVINRYCNKCEPLFNLFDDTRPFYQAPKLAGKEESVSSLMAHISSGADATLFNHNTKADSIRLDLDQAARVIVTIQSFGLAGTKGSTAAFTDAPCARGIMFFVEGDTLLETLMLNLPQRDLGSHRLKQREKDSPAWEQSNPFASDPQRPYGLLDHLTWQNRRIRLIEPKDSDNLVSQMIYAPGLKTSDVKKSVRDVFNPFHHWRAKADDDSTGEQSNRSHSPNVFRQDKALWRDSAVLFELPSDGEHRDKPPVPLVRARELADEGIISYEQSYRLLAIGACTKRGQDKTFFYRMENLPLPMKYLDRNQPELIGDLGTAIKQAEDVGKLLNRCAFLLAWLIRSPSTPDKNFDEESRIDTKINSGNNDKSKDREAQQTYQLFSSFGVERLYWSQLEAHFQRLIQNLPSDPEAAKEKWRGHLKSIACAAFNQAIAYTGTDLRAQRAIVKAEEQFRIGLARLLNIKESDSTNGGETNVTN
jgi:CRISPR system Cascade subunit CasA